MDFGNLRNSECGQSNPLSQVAAHFTQDHTLQSRIGGLPTDNSFAPPQSFRMNDLMQEMNMGAARRPADPNAPNQDIPWAHQEPTRSFSSSVNVERQSWQQFSNFYCVSPMTPFHEQVPQPFRFPPQPQPEQRANLHEDIAKLLWIEFDAVMKKRKQQIILENSIKHMTLLQKGLQLLAEGDTTGAIKCFEDLVKEDETCVDNWKLLGTTYMKNMQVEEAFGALKQGLLLEPHNLDVIMALAENYSTNQDVPETLATLLSWLMNHPEYRNVVPENFEHVSLSEEAFHEELVNMFIKAAQRRPIDHDYQVQNVLGLLMIINGDYDKAVDCFRSALQAKPEDPMLWNRLGLALGKMNRHEEAIGLFNYALRIDSAFLRAEYNIGLTWMNRKEFKEAAKHFLLILNRQTRGQSDNTFINYTSKTTWNLLHRCMSDMNRSDLRRAVLERDLKVLSRELGVS